MAVLDASFIVKLVLREPCSEAALRALRGMAASGEELHAPCIAVAEVLNAVWKHALLLRDISREEALRALERLRRLTRLTALHPAEELMEKGLRYAIEQGITVYDALYLVLAEELGQPLYTFDAKLAGKAAEAGVEARQPACGAAGGVGGASTWASPSPGE